MTKLLFINWLVTFVLEFLVLLLFFRKQWTSCLHYAALVNAIILPLATLLLGKLQIDWLWMEALIIGIEAAILTVWFNIDWWKALVISLIINVVSASFFPLLQYLGVNLRPLLE